MDKLCAKCGELKDHGANKNRPDGLHQECKDCRKVRYAGPGGDRDRARSRAYYAAHYDEIRDKKTAPEALKAQRERAAAYYKANPGKIAASKRAARLAQRGITEAMYTEILAAQHGHCALCDAVSTPSRFGRGRLAIDHCHDCEDANLASSVRGLLCGNCNSGRGNPDDVDRLRGRIAYLERHVCPAITA